MIGVNLPVQSLLAHAEAGQPKIAEREAAVSLRLGLEVAGLDVVQSPAEWMLHVVASRCADQAQT